MRLPSFDKIELFIFRLTLLIIFVIFSAEKIWHEAHALLEELNAPPRVAKSIASSRSP